MKTAKQNGGAADQVALLLEHLLGGRRRCGSAPGTRPGRRGRRPDPRGAVSAGLRRLLWNPDEIGLARAWVAGEIDVEGDLEEALGRLETIGRDLAARRQLSPLERAEMLRAAVLLGAVGPAPKPPPEERSSCPATNTPRAATGRR